MTNAPLFRVLWIDDDREKINDDYEKAEEIIRSCGQTPKIETEYSGKDCEKHFIRKNYYDLIITDYHLDTNLGTDIISFARKKGVLTDFILYSMEDRIIRDHEFRKKIGYSSLVNLVAGEQVLDRLKPIVLKIIDKENDIIFLRGYCISQAIDLENLIDELFRLYFNISDEVKIGEINILLETGNSITLKTKIAFVESICKKIDPTLEGKKYSAFMKPFQTIHNLRNKLAHCRKDPNDPTKLIIDNEGKYFCKDDYERFRLHINEAELNITHLIEICNT